MDKYITKNIIKEYAIANSSLKPNLENKYINNASLVPSPEIEIGIKEISLTKDIIEKVVKIVNDKDIDFAMRCHCNNNISIDKIEKSNGKNSFKS